MKAGRFTTIERTRTSFVEVIQNVTVGFVAKTRSAEVTSRT